MSLIIDINPVPWKILDLVRARILKNRAKKAKKGMDWSKETLKREMSLQPGPLSRRKREEPSFVPGARIHYSITILDENYDYFKGRVQGLTSFNGVLYTEILGWISMSQPVLTDLTGIISNYPGYTAVQLVDYNKPGPGLPPLTGVPGSFYTGSEGGFVNSYAPLSNLPMTPGLWMLSPVVTNTFKYKELLDRDWLAWSKKLDFEYESQNGLGTVSGSDVKRFILLVPQKKDSPGIQVYPTDWPNLVDDPSPSVPPIGVTIPVARQEESKSVITGPSDYFSLIEAATELPWSEVASVFIAQGSNTSFSDFQAFRDKLTEMSIPFAVASMGSIRDDTESWVNAHCTP